MITAIRSLEQVQGGYLFGIFFAGCMLLYLLFNVMIQHNRTPIGRMVFLIGAIAAAILCDVIWTVWFYPQGEYVNRGLGGSIIGMFVWPGVLICVTLIVNFINALNAPD